MQTVEATWESFFARCLRIDFFDGQWDSYRSITDSRAKWLQEVVDIDRTKPLLSCACGEGGIELALARLGFKVTAYDLMSVYIDFARHQAKKENLDINFGLADIRSTPLGEKRYGTVVCFDTVGLMSRKDDQQLIHSMVAATEKGGKILIDFPDFEAVLPENLNPEGKGEPVHRIWEVGGGELHFEIDVDKASRTQSIEVYYQCNDGKRLVLNDPYDSERPPHTGVLRYIYEPEEIIQIFQRAGSEAYVVPHQKEKYFLIVGNV